MASKQKKGYKLPRSCMTNSDITRLINSDEVQTIVRPTKTVRKGAPLKKNPLRNLGALLKLNPYAKTARRAELLQQVSRCCCCCCRCECTRCSIRKGVSSARHSAQGLSGCKARCCCPCLMPAQDGIVNVRDLRWLPGPSCCGQADVCRRPALAAACPGVLAQTAAGTQPVLPQNICDCLSDCPCALPHAACIAVPCCEAAHLNLISAKLLPAGLVVYIRELWLQAQAASAKAKGEKVSKARKERTKEAKEVSATL